MHAVRDFNGFAAYGSKLNSLGGSLVRRRCHLGCVGAAPCVFKLTLNVDGNLTLATTIALIIDAKGQTECALGAAESNRVSRRR